MSDQEKPAEEPRIKCKICGSSSVQVMGDTRKIRPDGKIEKIYKCRLCSATWEE